MREISDALRVGREVITHSGAVTVPGWRGAGYIILDPVTGDGAHKIGGGMSGGGVYEENMNFWRWLLGWILDFMIPPANADIAKGINMAGHGSTALSVWDAVEQCPNKPIMAIFGALLFSMIGAVYGFMAGMVFSITPIGMALVAFAVSFLFTMAFMPDYN